MTAWMAVKSAGDRGASSDETEPPIRSTKKVTFVYRQRWLFSTKFALRASEIASLWNICIANVKYSLTRMWANFISHCDHREQYFTMCVSTLFHIRQRRIFHLKNLQIYAIIFSERRCWMTAWMAVRSAGDRGASSGETEPPIRFKGNSRNGILA